MRIIFLVFAASVASQLPARDVPHSAEAKLGAEIIQAGQGVCREAARSARPLIVTGPTVFASAGSIA